MYDRWLLRGDVYSSWATLKPSELLGQLGSPSNPEPQIDLLGSLLENALKALDTPTVRALVERTLGPQAARDLERLTALDPKSSEYLRLKHQLATAWHAQILAGVSDFDKFPTIPLALIPQAQKLLLAKGQPTTATLSPKPFPKADDGQWKNTRLRAEGCPSRDVTKSLVNARLSIYTQEDPMQPQEAVSCFHENSLVLAELINRLSNNIAGESPSAELRVDDANYAVRDWASLLQAFSAEGFSIEAYNIRGFVNFLGYRFDVGGKPRAVRLATWFSFPQGSTTQTLPGEHGEIDLLVRRGDSVWANIRWFVGVPAENFHGVVAYWRPYTFKRDKWESLVREHLEIHPPENLSPVADWLEASAWTARGFQSVYDRLGVPMNGYGLFVCSDSAALVLRKVQEIRNTAQGSPRFESYAGHRLTNSFPLIRARTARVEGDIDALITRYGNVPSSILRDTAPDTDLYLHPESFSQRLQDAFPQNAHTLKRLNALRP
jgi:hypothetical protein